MRRFPTLPPDFWSFSDAELQAKGHEVARAARRSGGELEYRQSLADNENGTYSGNCTTRTTLRRRFVCAGAGDFCQFLAEFVDYARLIIP